MFDFYVTDPLSSTTQAPPTTKWTTTSLATKGVPPCPPLGPRHPTRAPVTTPTYSPSRPCTPHQAPPPRQTTPSTPARWRWWGSHRTVTTPPGTQWRHRRGMSDKTWQTIATITTRRTWTLTTAGHPALARGALFPDTRWVYSSNVIGWISVSVWKCICINQSKFYDILKRNSFFTILFNFIVVYIEKCTYVIINYRL